MRSRGSADGGLGLVRGSRGYPFALLTVSLAMLLRWALPEVLSPTPYLAFYPAVVAAAAFGGLGPGLLATTCSLLAVEFVLTPTVGQLSHDPLLWTRQGIFLFGGVGISLVAGMQHKARQRLLAQSQDLRESARKFRAVAEYTHDWEFWLAPDGHFLYVSPSCQNVTGYPAEAFLADAELAERIIHPDDRVLYKEHRGDGDAGGACVTEEVEFRILHRNGSVRWIGHACVPVHDEAGHFLGIRGSNRDITPRKEAEQALEESRRRLAGIINSAMDAIITVDEQQNVVLFNPAAEKMFACPATQAIGTRVERFIPQRFRAAHAGHIQRFGQTGETARAMGHLGAISGLRLSGEEFPIEASISQVTVEGRKLFSVILRDITERQQQHEALQQAKEAAEEASKAKDQFLAVLSHELRTPLAPVLATVTMLREDRKCDAEPETRDALELIRRNVELEARLIDDLLDVTRIARGKVELHRVPTPICQILEHTVEVCRPDILARELHFGLNIQDPPHLVNADAARLQQVFWNLIKNAVKFTPRNGCVGVQCWREGTEVVVEISDSGEGIEPEYLTRIFSAFEQSGRATTHRFGGLGLGLAISKAMVELHGGSISARSEGRGRGSTFIVRLPLVASIPLPTFPDELLPTAADLISCPAAIAATTAPAPTPQFPATAGTPGLRILLVEDHGDTAQVMRRLLCRAGHEVELAGDVAGALERIEHKTFDLLLSDLGLPDGSGVDLMRELRRRGYQLPGIALSGYGREEDLGRSREAGFACHLVKPITPALLQEAIAALCCGKSRRI